MDAIAVKRTLVWLEVKETALVLSASVILPFLVHLVPAYNGIPLGARLLPMFYAPFIAVSLFRPHVAIITGLFSPILNSYLTGHPTPENIAVLTVELVLFCIISYLVQRKWRHFWGVVIVSYLLTLLSVSFLLGRIEFFTNTLVVALPGLAMLSFINMSLLRLQSRS